MLNGELAGETKVYDLANDGVGYSISNEAIDAVRRNQLDELRQQIIDGDDRGADDAGRLSRREATVKRAPVPRRPPPSG